MHQYLSNRKQSDMNQDTPKPQTHDNAPIGIFDSGYGGLTVLKEIVFRLPQESIIFVGDSARCPYGPRDLTEVKDFTLQICSYLISQGCKLIVIACNTATAAGLKAAQIAFDVPIVGVIEAGSRAAVHMTRTRRIGIIATQGTINSKAYEGAIKNIDAGIEVYSEATPKFVEIAEMGLKHNNNYIDHQIATIGSLTFGDDWEQYLEIARNYLKPLQRQNIDTLVLGCTHFPIIQPLIAEVLGDEIRLVSSAEETARDVASILERRHGLASGRHTPSKTFYTTLDKTKEFEEFGALVLNSKHMHVEYLELPPFLG